MAPDRDSDPSTADPSAAGPLTSGVAATPVERLPDDLEGARLVAVNLALNGTPREETERYLAANFKLEDRGRLLDEVYASVADRS